MEYCGFNLIFLQKNGHIHISNELKNWFEKQNIFLLDHPPNNPDLGPTENAWVELVRKVYGNRQQYASITKPRTSVSQKWTLIHQKYFQHLIFSPGRIEKKRL